MGWLLLQETQMLKDSLYQQISKEPKIYPSVKACWKSCLCWYRRDFATKTWNYLWPLKPPGNASLAAAALSLPALRWVTFTHLAKLKVRNFWIFFLIHAVRALKSSHRGLLYPKARRNTYINGCLSFSVSFARINWQQRALQIQTEVL